MKCIPVQAASRASALAIGTMLALAATPALAQERLPGQPASTTQDSQAPAAEQATDEPGIIVVTAQRRAENILDVPIAVTAVNAETLLQTGVDSTDDLSQLVPSVQFTRSGASGLFFIRGVGTSNAAVGEEGSNAFYVDNVYIGDLAQTINNFNNIERVEVLRGPQGTLFGRNATGGLVHIITRTPGQDPVLEGEISYGNYDTLAARLYVSTPITDGIAADIAFSYSDQNEGWGRNLTLGVDNKLEFFRGVRTKWVFDPAVGVRLIFIGDYAENRGNLAIGWRVNDIFPNFGGTVSPGGFDSRSNGGAATALDMWGLSLTGEFDLGPVTLTSVTAMRDLTNASDFDVDGSELNRLQITFLSGTRAYQQEFRLASVDTNPFSWQLGLFYFRSEAYNQSIFAGAQFPAPAAGQRIDARLTTDSIAFFGEGTYAITPTTHVTGGLRYTSDQREIAGTVNVFLVNGTNLAPTVVDTGLSYNELTWRVALRQELNNNLNVYASVNRGFKAGTFSLQSPTAPGVLPQFITAYELGLKGEFFDRRLRFEVSGFHYDISDYQVRSAALNNNGVPGSSVLLNAAEVRVDGVEVTFDAQPTPNWRIFGGFTWLNSRFSDFAPDPARGLAGAPFIYPNPAVCDAPGTARPGRTTGPFTGSITSCFGDATGFQTPLAPDFTGNIGTTVTIPTGNASELRLSAVYSYNSGYPFEADNFLQQDSFQLVNGSIEYRFNQNLAVEVWGRNIFDERYYMQRISTAGIGATDSMAAPATYGATVRFRF